jgi:hypothetical protein
VQLDPVLEQALDVVERVRTVLMPRELDRLPDFLVGRRRLDAVELALELLELPGEARAAEQVEGPQARRRSRANSWSSPLRARTKEREKPAQAAARSRRCGRNAGSARQAEVLGASARRPLRLAGR